MFGHNNFAWLFLINKIKEQSCLRIMLWFRKCFVHDARYLYKEQFEKLNEYFKMYLTIDGLRDIILYNIRKGSSLLQAIHKKNVTSWHHTAFIPAHFTFTHSNLICWPLYKMVVICLYDAFYACGRHLFSCLCYFFSQLLHCWTTAILSELWEFRVSVLFFWSVDGAILKWNYLEDK